MDDRTETGERAKLVEGQRLSLECQLFEPVDACEEYPSRRKDRQNCSCLRVSIQT